MAPKGCGAQSESHRQRWTTPGDRRRRCSADVPRQVELDKEHTVSQAVLTRYPSGAELAVSRQRATAAPGVVGRMAAVVGVLVAEPELVAGSVEKAPRHLQHKMERG